MIPHSPARRTKPAFADVLLLIAALGLVLAFFGLPWLRFGMLSYTGRELLIAPPQDLQLYLPSLWLVRLGAIAGVFVGIWGLIDWRGRGITAMTAFFAGLIVLVYFGISLTQSAQGIIDLGSAAGSGFWVGLIAAGGLVLQAVFRRSAMKQQRRSLLLLPMLIFVLALLLFLVNATREMRFVNAGIAGEVLYATSFDAFAEDWNLFSGRQEAQIADGLLSLASEFSTDPFYSATRQYFTDFEASIDITATGGELNNAYGLIFRLEPNNPRDATDDRYYLFLISSDGYYRVTRVNGSERKVLSNWISTPIIQTGLNVVNTMRVVARGSAFAFFINDQRVPLCIPDDPNAESTYFGGQCRDGQMLDTLIDETSPNGQLGVVIFPQDTAFTSIAADNLIVLAPSENGLE